VTPDQVMLYYDGIHVGNVRGPIYSDRTWDGIFEPALSDNGELERRLLAFILLVQDWNLRCITDRLNPPPLSEFDPYKDVIDSELWHVRLADGTIFAQLDGAPVFRHGQGISWKCK
jgi:hypothetical protein